MSAIKLYCNFCGKRDDEVRKLIAGPNCFICNECVELCGDIVTQEPMRPTPAEISRAEDQRLECLKLAVSIVRDNGVDARKVADELLSYVTTPVPIGAGSVAADASNDAYTEKAREMLRGLDANRQREARLDR